PYESLASAIKATTPLLNALHGQSTTDERRDVWRDAAAARPTVKIPYLERAPRLNGELSDWPTSARLPGVKAVRTVGAERSKLALPNMLVGWREEGLYVAFEVSDDHVAAAPADGWWWSKDAVEFWVNTRPPRADQTSYDEFGHHFFFVPVDFPAADGVGGVVGQWHAPGDAIRATQLPLPGARVGVRVLKGGYTAEIFIPAKALNGFEPVKGNVLAFNASVRNYDEAAEYYWSAPKVVVTQARPNTWGTIYLEPKPGGSNPQVPIAGGVDATGSATGQ
ncbi:MAG TPA: sugar-binding protein, partial [Humisphaera sp.]